MGIGADAEAWGARAIGTRDWRRGRVASPRVVIAANPPNDAVCVIKLSEVVSAVLLMFSSCRGS